MNQLRSALKSSGFSGSKPKPVRRPPPPPAPGVPTMKRVFSRLSPKGLVQNQIRDVAIPPRRPDPHVHGQSCMYVEKDHHGLNVVTCSKRAHQSDLVSGWLCKMHFYALYPSRIVSHNDEPERIDAIITNDSLEIVVGLIFGTVVQLGPFKGLVPLSYDGSHENS